MNKNSDRKIDTWEWYDTEVYAKRLTFDVRLKRPVNVAAGPFEYYIDHDSPPINVSAPDLALLRNQLDAAVRAFYAVKWTSVIVVRIEQDVGVECGVANDFGVNIVVHPYEQGVMHGQPVYRRKRTSNVARDYDYFIKEGEIERQFSKYSGGNVQPQYILPDTPAMHAKLEEIRKSMGTWASTIREALEARVLK